MTNVQELFSQWQRGKCPTCKRSCKFFCPWCAKTVGVPENINVPKLDLPLKIDIIFQDKPKVSTAVHAKILAPESVEIIPVKEQGKGQIPDYDPTTTMLVYPSDEATHLSDIAELKSIKRLVLIDCPWQKAPVLITHSSLKDLRQIKLQKPPTLSNYWRYHHAGNGCVSTIEALRLVVLEYMEAMGYAKESTEIQSLDDLLFFFDLLHNFISQSYDADPSNKGYLKPFEEEAKEKQRQSRYQKEIAKVIKAENKKRKMEKENNDIKIRNGRCFNCKDPNHEARDCTLPCKYCKKSGHWSGGCPEKFKKKLKLRIRTQA